MLHVERDGTTYLKRPGKKEKGISASWNHVPDRLYVFTTDTSFENEHVYKASAVYAVLEHNSNWKAAAMALAKEGYGSLKPRLVAPVTAEDTSEDDIKTFDRLERDWLRMQSRKSMTSFGFPTLNIAAKQFGPGEVFTIAARSGVGKTTLGMTLQRNTRNPGWHLNL